MTQFQKYLAVWTWLAACGTAARPMLNAHVQDTQEVKRKAVVIFYAGLEGAGHHFLKKMEPKLQSKVRMGYIGNGRSILPGLDCDEPGYNSTNFVKLRKVFANLDPGVVYLMPHLLSYPHCGMNIDHMHEFRRDVLHPDAGFMAQAADEAGVEFRVLFLHRPIMKSLVAGCIHRPFEKCEPYVETLVSNADYLVQNLNTVGLHRAHCFSFGDIDSMASALDAVYGPGLTSREEVEGTFRSGSAHGEAADREVSRMEHRLGHAAMQRLRAADENLNHICEDMRGAKQ